MDFTLDGLFYLRSSSTSVTTHVIPSVNSLRPQRALPCLNVTLSNIISTLIYPAAFCIINVIPRADRVISTENIISRNKIGAQISTASLWLLNILRICVCNITYRHPHFYLQTFVRCHTFVLQVSVTVTSGCRLSLT